MKKKRRQKKLYRRLILELLFVAALAGGVLIYANKDRLFHKIGSEPYEEVQEVVAESTEEEAVEEEPEEEEAENPYQDMAPTKRCLVDASFWDGCPPRKVELLTPNPYSRPQFALVEVNDIVIHFVDNPGTTAMQNRNYFESLKDGSRSASSHFIVGLDGEIVQCVSCSEIAYASNSRNNDSISIECCHPDDTGKFNDATYESVVNLTAWLCKAFGCGPDHVIRHYDVTGKDCPRYYVENPEAWEKMKQDIADRYAEIS